MDDIFEELDGFAISAESEPRMARVITRSSSMLFNAEPVNEPNARAFLREHCWPTGLQDAFVNGLNKIPIRFFICDDSGSMTTNDGMKFETFDNKQIMVTASRWSELAECLVFHAELAHYASAPTEFRLLNNAPPIRIGFNQITTTSTKGVSPLGKFLKALQDSPYGQTPLCKHISEVIAQITLVADELREAGQLACLIIASDGEATDGTLAKVMKPLKALPVWVVIRLCTNDPAIIKYWNDIDKELELNMDVLDDFYGEAREIKAKNPWLTYGEPLHRMREFGVHIKEIDLLDEQPCELVQIRQICSILFGGKLEDYPHPEADWPGFCSTIRSLNASNPAVLSPVVTAGVPRHWINLHKLQRQRAAKQNKCAIS